MAAKVDSTKCIGCGDCTTVCPVDIIEMVAGVAQITDEDACIECAACEAACGSEAITLD